MTGNKKSFTQILHDIGDCLQTSDLVEFLALPEGTKYYFKEDDRGVLHLVVDEYGFTKPHNKWLFHVDKPSLMDNDFVETVSNALMMVVGRNNILRHWAAATFHDYDGHDHNVVEDVEFEWTCRFREYVRELTELRSRWAK